MILENFVKKVAINSIVIHGLTTGTTAELPPLPFQALNDFQNFDESIKMEKEKEEALV